MRIFVYISYKGTNYHGWQIQDNAITIQQVITETLQVLLRDLNVSIVGSGRTDTGVHASEQVFHTDIDKDVELEKLAYKLNGILPDDIVVNKIEQVKEEAHTRFDAIARSYEYHLRTIKSPFCRDEEYFYPVELNFEAMNKAASYLVGEHDFQSFSRVKTEVNNFICTITKAEWELSEGKAVFHITANRFLRGMVRAVVGTLLLVGEEKMKPEEIVQVMEKRNRNAAGRAVPAKGLYLCKVEYPNSIKIKA